MKALRKSLFSALSLVILVGVLAPNTWAAGLDPDDIAGSYVGAAEPQGQGGADSVPLLFMIHDDNTILVREPFPNTTAAIGTWKNGEFPRQIAGNLEQFVSDVNDFLAVKIFSEFIQTFDENFETFTGIAIRRTFLCSPGTTPVCDGPPSTPTDTRVFDYSGTRISAD